MPIADTLTEVGLNGSITSLSAPGKATGATTINIGSTANWPSTGKTVFFAIRTVNPSAVTTANPSGLVAGTYSEWKGIVGTNSITGMVLQAGSIDQTYTAGTNTQVLIPVTASRENALVTWGQVHADNQGNLLTAAVQTALGLGTSNLNGWNPLANTPNTVVANGNRSYTCTFNSVDLTATLSPGFRFRTTRTVAAPTQSTSLNGTTQYWSKVAPAGMTFTDNFTLSAWVKVSSYATGVIISRIAGATGFQMYVNASGQLQIFGGGAATRTVNTYQSLPLNKWVHVAATLNMAGGTSTTYIDGVSVPNTVAGAGTSLTQSGNLYVGNNDSTSFFPGKIAQAAVFSTVLSQATIQGQYSQGLIGTETSLISAYSFNGTANDLNTTNANNLTANGAVTATAVDSPYGGQGNGTISSTLDYGIVQSVSFATNTTVVVQVAEGCTIPTSGGVSAVAYSSVKVPYNFPSSRGKWQIITLNKTFASKTSPVAGTWYNDVGFMNISIPIGSWNTSYSITYGGYKVTATAVEFQGTLSTSATTETDSDFTTWTVMEGASGTMSARANIFRQKTLDINTATIYYFIAKAITATAGEVAIYAASGNSPAFIIAENAYL